MAIVGFLVLKSNLIHVIAWIIPAVFLASFSEVICHYILPRAEKATGPGHPAGFVLQERLEGKFLCSHVTVILYLHKYLGHSQAVGFISPEVMFHTLFIFQKAVWYSPSFT